MRKDCKGERPSINISFLINFANLTFCQSNLNSRLSLFLSYKTWQLKITTTNKQTFFQKWIQIRKSNYRKDIYHRRANPVTLKPSCFFYLSFHKLDHYLNLSQSYILKKSRAKRQTLAIILSFIICLFFYYDPTSHKWPDI